MNELMLVGAGLVTGAVILLAVGTLVLRIWHMGVVRRSRKRRKGSGLK